MDRGNGVSSTATSRRSLLQFVGGTAAMGTLPEAADGLTAVDPSSVSPTDALTTNHDAGGWTAYRGSSRRAGINATTTGPVDDFELAWRRDLDVEPIETDGSPFSTVDAGLNARGDGSAQYAPPAVADERVFVSTPRSVHCLDLLTGEEVWRVDPENPVLTQPALDDERAYVGTNRDTGPPNYEEIGEIVALDRSDGSVQWRTEPASLGDIPPKLSAGPVVADGTVYATTVPSSETRTGTGIAAVDVETGEKRWSAGTSDYRAVSLAVEGDWVTTTTSGYYSPFVFMLRDEGDAFSNAWSWEAGPFKTPAIRNGVAYYTRDSSYHLVTAESGEVVRESANASHEWYGEGQSPPVVGRNRVYRFFWGGDEAPPRIVALDGSTGDVAWRTDPDFASDATPGQLTAAAGALYLTHGVGEATKIRAFDPETGNQIGEHLIDAETSPAVPVAPGLLALVEYVEVDDGVVPRVRVVDGTQSERPTVTDADVTRRWCAARATASTASDDLTGDAGPTLASEVDAVRGDDALSNAGKAELLDRLHWGAGVTLQAHRLAGLPGDGGGVASPPGECDPDAVRGLGFPNGEVDLIATTLRTAITMIQETVALKKLVEKAAEEVETGESILSGAAREADSLGSYVDEVVLAGGDDVFQALFARRGTIEDKAVETFGKAYEAPEPVQRFQESVDGIVSEVRGGVRSALLGAAGDDVDRVADGIGPSAVGGTGPSTGYSGAGIAFQHGYDSMTTTAAFASEVMNSVLTVLNSADYINAVVELRDYLEGDDVDPLTLFGLVEPLLGIYGQIAKVLAAAAATAVGGLALKDVAEHQRAAVDGVIEGAPR